MKGKLHIPTEQYGFIEVEFEHDDPVALYNDLSNQVKETEGYNINEWAKIRKSFLLTNELDPDIIAGANKAQRYWINETKNTLRAIKKEDE